MYKSAIIGCGRIGVSFGDDPLRGPASTHAGAYGLIDGVDLVTVCDSSFSRACAAETMLGVSSYLDYRAMMDSVQPNIISVCTPPETHAEIVCDLAKHFHPQAIFCEKPIAHSLEAAWEMIKACSENGVALFINHQRRFNPCYNLVAESLGELIGDVVTGSAYYGAGILNTGTHLIDLLRLLIGKEIEWAQGRWVDNINVTGYLGFDGNIPISIQAGSGDYALLGITFIGTTGKLYITDNHFIYEQAQPSHRFSNYRELFISMFENTPDLKPDGGKFDIALAVQHIVDYLNGDAVEQISSGIDGLAALRAVLALSESRGKMICL